MCALQINWDVVSALAESVSAVVAAVAIYFGAKVSKQIHLTQTKFERSQALLPFWKEMSELSRIGSADPDPETFRVALNTLSLLAQFEKLEIVQPDVLREMFHEAFNMVYNDIVSTNVSVTVAGQTKPGRDFLQAIPEVGKLAKRWG